MLEKSYFKKHPDDVRRIDRTDITAINIYQVRTKILKYSSYCSEPSLVAMRFPEQAQQGMRSHPYCVLFTCAFQIQGARGRTQLWINLGYPMAVSRSWTITKETSRAISIYG